MPWAHRQVLAQMAIEVTISNGFESIGIRLNQAQTLEHPTMVNLIFAHR